MEVWERGEVRRRTNKRRRRGRKSSACCLLLPFLSLFRKKTQSKRRLHRPMRPLSNSPDQRRHRPKPIPMRTAGGKAVPASGRRLERARRAGEKREAARESIRGALTSRVLSLSFSPHDSKHHLVPVSRQSAQRSSPLGRGATRTSPSRSWPAGDTSDSATATHLLLSSATPLLLLPLGWRSRSWWRAFLWKRRRKRKMRTRARADLLRRRRR